ncbi:hypothetical protein O181_002943 [Austropuccinia psidii MF-1]|uniref:Chromo domain-containing protein n=1 Tax=Austropuccinia psidii MF-1 TaxID=1389203 RepID=A0A9Q3BDP5_9BASI|nr:hypothetical protein [Austropuccinia psidii MF-1]
MRDTFVGPFTIIKLIGKMQWSQTTLPERRGNVLLHPPDKVEIEDLSGPVKTIIKARKIGLNGQDQRHYLVRFKSHRAYKDKWMAEDAIPGGNLHLRRLRAARKTE